MKKRIPLFLTLLLLMCMGISVIAAEDGDCPPKTSVSDSFDTVLTSSSGEDEQSAEPQTSDSAGEPEMPETTGSSEVSQEPANTEENGGMESPGNGELGMENEILDDSPVPMSGEIYNLTISWTGMNFTYKPAPQGEWDPKSLSYGERTGKPTWTSSDGNGYGTFTVTCNSTVSDITVTFEFKKNSAFTPTAKMKFSTDPKSLATMDVKDNIPYIEFDSGDSNDTKYLYVLPTVNTKTTTAESFAAADNKLGGITITVEVTEMGDPTHPGGPEILD